MVIVVVGRWEVILSILGRLQIYCYYVAPQEARDWGQDDDDDDDDDHARPNKQLP
jgi:hypothetical protein